MGKIKGWTKQRDNWYVSNVGSNIQITKNNVGNLIVLYYPPDLILNNGVREVQNARAIGGLFKTKQQALDYAIKYMRLHPRG